METYGISREHMRVFQDFADDSGNSIDERMPKMKKMAQNKGIPLQELAPYMLREIATTVGHDVRGVGAGRVQEPGGDDCLYACQEIWKRHCLNLGL